MSTQPAPNPSLDHAPDATVPLVVGLLILGFTVFLALTGTGGFVTVLGLLATLVAAVAFLGALTSSASDRR